MEAEVLDRILEPWLREWNLATASGIDLCDCRHVWFWDGQEHVDPAKEATAQQKRLESCTTNLAIEYAKQGRDWEVEMRQIAKEKALKKELGIDDTAFFQNSEKEKDEDGNEE